MKIINNLNYYQLIKKLLLAIVIICQLSSCQKMKESLSKPWLLDTTPPPGPPIYQAAYVDGCKSALQENQHNSFAKATRIYKHPVYNKTSNLYRKMWRSAMTYCYLWWPKMRHPYIKASFKFKVKGIQGSKKRAYLDSAPPGPRNFRIGWKDGCRTGKSATGTNKYKVVYGFKKDPRFIEGDKFNSAYEKGWETAFWYCQRYYDIYEDSNKTGLM